MHNRGRQWSAIAVVVGLMLVVAACGSDKKSSNAATSSGGSSSSSGSASSGGGDKAGALAGMKGTTPLVDLGSDIKASLDAQGIDNKKTYNYGAESHDAVVIIALAAAQAKTDGVQYAAEINKVTRGGTKCTTFKECNDLITAGTDIDYDGRSGPLEFSGNGEPTVASYGVQVFGSDNHIDDAKTVFKTAQAPASADVAQVPVEGTRAGDGTLKIGTLLPETGSLAFLGPPEVAAVKLAVKDINAAGGVLDKDVVLVEGDSGDTETDIANTTVDRL